MYTFIKNFDYQDEDLKQCMYDIITFSVQAQNNKLLALLDDLEDCLANMERECMKMTRYEAPPQFLSKLISILLLWTRFLYLGFNND